MSEPRWRAAGAGDAEALRDLERESNLVALRHVFGDAPYPDADVLARWREVLGNPGIRVEVVEGPSVLAQAGLVALVAYDERLHHLAVHPTAWGRGLAGQAVQRAVAGGARRLWVLELNTRARGLYEHLGWLASGAHQDCPWPPYPVELEYRLP